MMQVQGVERVTIAYIGLLSSARIGAAVGAVFSLLPAVLFAFGGTWAVHWTRTLLDGWSSQAIRLPLVGNVAQLNVVQLLQLEGPYSLVAYWDDRLLLTFALLWLVPWSLAVIGGALFAAILALVYNSFGMLGGGVEVAVTPTVPRGASAASGRAQYFGAAERGAPQLPSPRRLTGGLATLPWR
jgi:hypothetical protein